MWKGHGSGPRLAFTSVFQIHGLRSRVNGWGQVAGLGSLLNLDVLMMRAELSARFPCPHIHLHMFEARAVYTGLWCSCMLVPSSFFLRWMSMGPAYPA